MSEIARAVTKREWLQTGNNGSHNAHTGAKRFVSCKIHRKDVHMAFSESCDQTGEILPRIAT